MLYKLFCSLVLVTGFVWIAAPAEASVITVTLPEFNGPLFDVDAAYPLAEVQIGTFTFSVPSDKEIVDAWILGTFGNSVNPTTAGVMLFLDDVAVATCSKPAPCYSQPPPDHWTSSVSTDLLMDGSARFSAIQTSEFRIRLGTTKLKIRIDESPRVVLIIFMLTLYLAYARIKGTKSVKS
jgi:hypothetical protein